MKNLVSSLLHVLSAVVLIAVVTVSAKADKYYAFIGMSCNKAAREVIISSVESPDSNPQNTVEKLRSGKITDLYFLDDISKTHQKILCDLGEQNTISFTGNKSEDHPGRDDSISVFLNDEKIPGWFSVLKKVKIKISVTNSQDYTVDSCWIKNEPPEFDLRVCQTRHILNGKIVEQSKPIPTKE